MATRLARPSPTLVVASLSPTLVVASLAMLVALTGTSLAAVRIVIPSGSVGTAQLKANAVTSAKVKNGALQASDVKASLLVPGPAGPTGTAGAAGAAGEPGVVGPTDAFSHYVAGPVAVPAAATTLSSLSIPVAGRYVIYAKGTFVGPGPVLCGLAAESDTDISGSITSPSAPFTISNTLTHEFAGAGAVNFNCGATAGPTYGAAIRITAVKVDSLTAG